MVVRYIGGLQHMMQSANIQNFKYLSRFKDLSEFNNHIEQWMLDIKSEFTKSELLALKRLIRFSAKVVGVCNAKIGTVVSATHEKDGAGISRSTFKRMIQKAKEIGLLSVYETVRKNGSKSSNVYVFNPLSASVSSSLKTDSGPSSDEKLNRPQTSNLSKTSKIKIYNKRNTAEINVKNEIEKLDASFVSENVPKAFTNFVRCFFNDAKQIEEYWKLVTISARKNGVTDNVVETAIQAFKALIRKIKFSNVTNTYGYFYGVLNRKFKALYVKGLLHSCWGFDF